LSSLSRQHRGASRKIFTSFEECKTIVFSDF
jgi:hypothetical protein